MPALTQLLAQGHICLHPAQGVRELGLAAWLSAHLAYALVLVVAIGPLTKRAAALGRREPRSAGLRGE